ncbi:PREDICTED: cadherin-related family member 5 [Condylura cristata]|uniref:cadherin-related family member 5 n=1 Tax=Condylura cristata TaxID=143302 RepID=UPI000643B11A|nr:PREDICTED: cadherin-related family member 5 [Condylura cristata]
MAAAPLNFGPQDAREENAVINVPHTASTTLVLQLQPADLRPPWFLPCVYEDSQNCVQAQYRGTVPTGIQLPEPLPLFPGPIYAEDGDRAIGQRVSYSIMHDPEHTFVLNETSGNLTMSRSVPSPRTFNLLVKAEQEDKARYSVTLVTIKAEDRDGDESLPAFPLQEYRGFLALGGGPRVAVKDTSNPSQPLTVRAHDPKFPVEPWLCRVCLESEQRDGASSLDSGSLGLCLSGAGGLPGQLGALLAEPGQLA